MAETTKWTDPRDAPRAAILRVLNETEHLKQRRRDYFDAAGKAPKDYDAWRDDHPDASEEMLEAQGRALKAAVESAEAGVAHIDRLLARQPERIAAARAKSDDANWTFFVTEDKQLQVSCREQLQRFLETPPTQWKKWLPELGLTAILIERGREEVRYLGRQSLMPPNVCPLPGYCESVPNLMKFFSLMSGQVMNGLAGRIVVKQP